MTSRTFSPIALSVLRNADRRLRSAERGDMVKRYAACRTALASLAPIESFYVGHYRGESTLVIPYTVDREAFNGSTVQDFGPHGMSAWIRASRRPYRYADDNGRMLGRGYPFGKVDERSQDALIVPLLDRETGEATGLMAALSGTPDVFDDEVAHAAQWLAKALVSAAARDADEAEDLDLYALYPELDSTVPRSDTDLVVEVSSRLERLHVAIEELQDHARAQDDGKQLASATRARALCEQAQTHVAHLLLHQPVKEAAADPLAPLTDREREIAQLIAEGGHTNSELAERLVISEKTVKGHVGGILRKLGISQRSSIAYVIDGAEGSEDVRLDRPRVPGP
ncbi:helix-turn-helix transcriptional regulator [Luteipulveratus mongoliensis]|uniref:helix-turn-helix transcriptional regulator n=1 Tax=Luteipulveratus mongoliensis TaxID=571913 RepID=UPI000698F46F|nr:helix-turn-helix transcriptional regulator [Luteipulveratus mongoliensis]